MKRYIALFSILIVFASVLVGCDLNRMGKDTYYVQITEDGKAYEGKADNGTKYTDYQYKLAGFDEEGKEKNNGIYCAEKSSQRSISSHILLR